jgi:hypothetical protein
VRRDFTKNRCSAKMRVLNIVTVKPREIGMKNQRVLFRYNEDSEEKRY